MNFTAGAQAEQRLAEFSFMTLLDREAVWAEIADDLVTDEEMERQWRPAPVTLRPRRALPNPS